MQIIGEHLYSYVKTEKYANMSTKEVLDIFIKICSQVDKLHKSGFVHTNINPQGIYLTNNDEPIVIIDDSTIIEKNKTAMCSFITNYSPSEAYLLDTKKRCSLDVYSLGAVLYYMMSGKNLQSAMDRMIEDRSEEDLNNYIENAELRKIIKKAVSMEDRKRYKTVGALIKAVNKI